MDKIFAKTPKKLAVGTVKPSKPSPSELIFKNWDPSIFLLYDVKLYEKKNRKNWWSCIAGIWEKEQNQIDKVGVQLIFLSHKDIDFQLQYCGTFL